MTSSRARGSEAAHAERPSTVGPTEPRRQEPTAGVDPEPYANAGATWWLPEIEPGTTLDVVRGVLHDGPAA